MLFRSLSIIILIGCFSLQLESQNSSYLDSLYNVIKGLPKEEQIHKILEIPYDKSVSNIEIFQDLTEKAIIYAKELNDTLLLARAYDRKILALHFTSRTEEALELTLKTIRLFEKLEDSIRVGKMYSELAWKLKYKDFDKAFDYMKKGISLREGKIRDEALFSSYDNLGVLYGMKNEWDSAKYYHSKTLEFRKEVKDSVGIPFAFCHLANVYLNTNKFNLAESYLDSALTIRQKRKDIYGITDSRLYLGDLHYAKKDYQSAIREFEKAFDLADKNEYYPLKKYASEYLFKSYENLKDYKNAHHYNLIFTTLKDSINNVQTNSKVAQLEIEYQTEKKEKEILAQRAELAESELAINQKNNYIMGLGGLILVLGLLGYLFYNQQRLKNRQLQKEKELGEALIKIETQNQLQDQRLRISRDLHDNIGAQLTFIISSLDNLKFGFDLNTKLNQKLNKISEFTGSTIYELRDTIWAMNKCEITFEDLKIRIINFLEKAGFAFDNIEFQFEVKGDIKKKTGFTSFIGMNVYRIIQEAVNNSIKYAEASLIRVEFLQSEEDTLIISISDNGKGFQLGVENDGNGINNIKKRAADIGAIIDIESKTNEGTTIKLNL